MRVGRGAHFCFYVDDGLFAFVLVLVLGYFVEADYGILLVNVDDAGS
jgi:hypothetical protein